MTKKSVLIHIAISGDRNVIKKDAEKILKYDDLTTEIQRVWEEKKCDASNSRDNWNPLKIIQKMPKQHDGKAQIQGNTENRSTGCCNCTLESNDVKVQKI
jgi:hypothetical protein